MISGFAFFATSESVIEILSATAALSMRRRKKKGEVSVIWIIYLSTTMLYVFSLAFASLRLLQLQQIQNRLPSGASEIG